MLVISFANYLFPPPYSDNSFYNSMKFVKAIKGEPIKGYSLIPSGNHENLCRLQDNTRHLAFELFAKKAAKALSRETIRACVLVPVPNSHVSIGFDGPMPTYNLAAMIAEKLEGVQTVDLAPALRWRQPMLSSHKEKGTRDANYLMSQLVVVSKLYRNVDYVLIDDVMTSGGHMKACAAALRSKGGMVDLGICAARTIYDAAGEKPFGDFENELPDI